VLLTGDGAERFASDCGLYPEPTLSSAQCERWQREIKPKLEGHGSDPLIELIARSGGSRSDPFDTVVMVVSDGQGLSCASSTSGWPWKHPGRVGDAPIPGAGFYVDSRYGWCGCTHTGEMAMRSGTARYVVSQLEFGRTIHDAVENAILDLSSLTGGTRGGVAVHAIDRSGNARVVALDINEPVQYWYWSETMARAECRIAEPASSFRFMSLRADTKALGMLHK
jgi:N4-(beta-N-acetylglucosaminyl)-L-asparaginase